MQPVLAELFGFWDLVYPLRDSVDESISVPRGPVGTSGCTAPPLDCF